MYVDMSCKSLVVSRWSLADPRKGWSSSAMRAESIRLPIVDGDGGFRESASIGKRVGHADNCGNAPSVPGFPSKMRIGYSGAPMHRSKASLYACLPWYRP